MKMIGKNTFMRFPPQEPLFSLLPKDKPPPRIIIHNSPAALEKKSSVCVSYYNYYDYDDYYYYYQKPVVETWWKPGGNMVTKCLCFLIWFLYENDRQKHFHEVPSQEPLFSTLPKDKPPPRIIINKSPAALGFFSRNV
jgi:hypothetical protein